MRINDGFDRARCLERLGGVEYGRVGFLHVQTPVVEPVALLVDDEEVVLLLRAGSRAELAIRSRSLVTVEVDDYDPRTARGWWTRVTGSAQFVVNPVEVGRYSEVVSAKGERHQDYRYVRLISSTMVGGLFGPSIGRTRSTVNASREGPASRDGSREASRDGR